MMRYTLIAILLFLFGNCALLGPKKGRLQIINQTHSTEFCAISDAQYPLLEHRIAAGQNSEVEIREGEYSVCLKACSEARNYEGKTTNTVGCERLEIRGGAPKEIVVIEGKDPDLPAESTGYSRSVWQNALDPALSDPDKRKPWLTLYGDPKPTMWHVNVANKHCGRSVTLKFESARGRQQRATLEAEQNYDFWGVDAPTFIYFMRGVAGRPQKAWDVPNGSFYFEVSKSCDGIELARSAFPDGSDPSKKPAKVTGRN